MLDEYWQKKLEESLEICKNRKEKKYPIYDGLPPLPRVIHPKYDTRKNTYEVKSKDGHWMVYENGRFYCSAETKEEAYRAIP